MNTPHLIDTTMSSDFMRTFVIGMGYTEDDLTDLEKELLKASEIQLAINRAEEEQWERDRKHRLETLASYGIGMRDCCDCGGEGYIYDDGDEYPCDTCDGSGKETYILEEFFKK